MIFARLADLTLLLHVAFVLFVVGGGLLVRRWPRLLLPHVAAAAWGVFIAATSGTCPLTPLENWFSCQAGRAGYRGGFLEHYLGPALYPESLTREAQWAEAGLVLAVNGFVYAPLVRRRWRDRRRRTAKR